jgi:hypothetical protein
MALSPAQRVATPITRLARVREELAALAFISSPQARALGDQIEEFGLDVSPPGCTPCRMDLALADRCGVVSGPDRILT